MDHMIGIVPGSGGKDSFVQSYRLKHEFGNDPSTITWAPHIYISWGWAIFQSWIHSGFDNYFYLLLTEKFTEF